MESIVDEEMKEARSSRARPDLVEAANTQLLQIGTPRVIFVVGDPDIEKRARNRERIRKEKHLPTYNALVKSKGGWLESEE